MLRKIFIYFVFLVSMQNFAYAHTVVLNMVDNEDGTMEIFGGFSTGQSAAGAKLIIKSQLSSKVLYETRVPNSGIITVKIPNESYKIILDSGPGHVLEKSGNIKPKNGFDKTIKTASYSVAFIVTFSLTMFFILLSIFIAIKKSRLIKKL